MFIYIYICTPGNSKPEKNSGPKGSVINPGFALQNYGFCWKLRASAIEAAIFHGIWGYLPPVHREFFTALGSLPIRNGRVGVARRFNMG